MYIPNAFERQRRKEYWERATCAGMRYGRIVLLSLSVRIYLYYILGLLFDILSKDDTAIKTRERGYMPNIHRYFGYTSEDSYLKKLL